MNNPDSRCKRAIRRSLIVVSLLLIILGGVLLTNRLTRPPESQAEAEAHLQRDVIAYALWDDTPYVMVEFDGKVRFDRLILDPFSMEWPPTPRWQWTGSWTSLDLTTDAASVAFTRAKDDRVIFGQINDPAIVTMDIRINNQWQSYSVAAPGYMIRLTSENEYPAEIRGLDAGGSLIWTTGGTEALADVRPYGIDHLQAPRVRLQASHQD